MHGRGRHGAGLRVGAAQGHAHDRVSLRRVHREAFLQPLVKGVQGQLGGLGRLRRTRNGEPVAARDQRNAELLFDARQVLVVLAEQQGQQRVVVELHQGGRFGFRGLAGFHVRASAKRAAPVGARFTVGAIAPSSSPGAPITVPERLLGWASSTRTGTIRPDRPAGAWTWTACM